MVGGSVFEVAVLYELGIEASVGAIVDILEKYADESVGYRLGFGRLGGDGDIYGLHAGETRGVVSGFFIEKCLTCTIGIVESYHRLNEALRHCLHIAGKCSAADFDSIGSEAYGGVHIGRKVIG